MGYGLYLVALHDENDSAAIPKIQFGESPQAELDQTTGEFMFTNLQPGRYAVVVLTRDGVERSAQFKDSGGPAIVLLSEEDRNQTIEIGFIVT